MINSKEDVDYLIELINRAKKLSKDNISDVEAISSLGEGWVAEETFAIAIYSCLKYPNSFKDAIICSINHDGDSDSTGTVAGNIVGAYLGYDAIPDYYKDNVELKDIILELADDMSVDVPISEYSSNKDEKWENKYLYCKYIKDKKDTKKTLERNSLSELYGYHSKKNINDEDSALEYINKIDSILSSYSFTSDENFMLLGRKKLIYDEICEILNESKTVDNPLSFVLGSLEEFICNNNFVYMSDSDHWKKGWEDLRNRNDIYSQKNIICLEEKNIIEDIINKIKSYIENKKNSDNNKLTKSYYKQRETDTIWWVENPDTIGEHLFTFDKEIVFNLFKDYPHALTPEQKKIFDKENPYWADYFKDRQ